MEAGPIGTWGKSFKLFGITSYGESRACWASSSPPSLETRCENGKTKAAMTIFTVRVKVARGKPHFI